MYACCQCLFFCCFSVHVNNIHRAPSWHLVSPAGSVYTNERAQVLMDNTHSTLKIAWHPINFLNAPTLLEKTGGWESNWITPMKKSLTVELLSFKSRAHGKPHQHAGTCTGLIAESGLPSQVNNIENRLLSDWLYQMCTDVSPSRWGKSDWCMNKRCVRDRWVRAQVSLLTKDA